MIFKNSLNKKKYIVVKYYLQSKTDLKSAAWNLAIGQSVGNPNVRNHWETDELFERHSCKILGNEDKLSATNKGIVHIGFPLDNINLKEDGISQLLCQIMGGQLDIGLIEKCHVLQIDFPDKALSYFNGPKYGIDGIRKFTQCYDKPILGGIIKPKIGISPKVLLSMVKQLVDGGVNFIKEDEIMSNPPCCTIEQRVPLIMDYLKEKNIIYSVCINSDAPYLLDRVKKVHELGGNSVHVNFWSGLGSYKAIRELDLPIFIHFQKSGDKILTKKTHDFHIDWSVICQLAAMMGVDFIHAGMWGGYSNDNENDLHHILSMLTKNNVMPALSCGMHPGLVNAVTDKFGFDYMANCGGAIHGHPKGTQSGASAMRQAIDGTFKDEYYEAVAKWGKVE